MYADEGPRLARNIGDKLAIILCDHGLLAWGDPIMRAFMVLWLLNRACEVQLASISVGSVLEILEATVRNCTHDSLQSNSDFGAGEDVFAVLTRAIDHTNSSYRT